MDSDEYIQNLSNKILEPSENTKKELELDTELPGDKLIVRSQSTKNYYINKIISFRNGNQNLMLSETVNKKDKEKFISKTQETIEKAKRALKHVKNGKWLTTITDSNIVFRVSKVRTDFYSEAQTIGGESNSMFIFDVSVRTDQGPSSIIIGDLSLEETRRPQKYLVRSQVGTCKAYSKKELVHLIKEQARYLQ